MMRWKPLAWILVSLLCFVAAYYFWQWGERRAGRGAPPAPTESPSTEAATRAPTAGAGTGDLHLLSQSATGTNEVFQAAYQDALFPYRLRNTPAPLAELMRSETSILLENALLDTARGDVLPVPNHLRSTGDPGTYIVQARGAIAPEFRQLIAAGGGTIISYVPNNAYLVRAASGAVSAMEASPLTQSVTPFEPYFKLKGELLESAVEHKPLAEGSELTVVLFADAQRETTEALRGLNCVIVGEDRSPFGPVLKLRVPPDSLPTLAGLSGVQMIDRTYRRAPATDLIRPRLGVADSSENQNNYRGLTGSNVVLLVVDSGVDANHDDLKPRVFADPVLDPLGLSLTDTDGHGTHVAGIVAGNGSQSAGVTNPIIGGSVIPAVTNQFRGMADDARIVSVGAISGGLTNPVPNDSDLQESAVRNNALISNNSWRQLGNFDYDIQAASYDAATRDALPENTGSQPVLFVFAAGNEGNGDQDGTGGLEETVASPATAKNVITVGAVEQLRQLTNSIVVTNIIDGEEQVTTNTPFDLRTDSDYQLAYYSSRGNVGIGLEGDFGRFKPDLVAPGEFVISARSEDWDTNAYYSPTLPAYVAPLEGQEVEPGQIIDWIIYIPPGTVRLDIFLSPALDSPIPLPDMPIYVSPTYPLTPSDLVGSNSVSLPPPTLDPTDAIWFYGVGNPTDELITFDITTVIYTNAAMSDDSRVLFELNQGFGPDYAYRFESGTSMAAPAVSGVLALIQQYFQETFHYRPSPALLKALLINGSRSTSPLYHFEVNGTLNDQGWGIFNLPNILANISNEIGSSNSVFFVDQNTSTALATGESQTRTVHLAESATNEALRVTLVWTDPPGNPLVGTKLVNDLDLVVTNTDTLEAYVGNDIETGNDWTRPLGTNAPPNIDLVNNVENVFIQGPIGSNYSVTVRAKRANVNAVTAHPNDVVQDYALVISYGDSSLADAFTVSGPVAQPLTPTEVTVFTNIVVGTETASAQLERQRVGSNSPLLPQLSPTVVDTNGSAQQWHFFVITNVTTFTNAAFSTFAPSELSIPRMGVFAANPDDNANRYEADIDLYVSYNPGLTNLDPGVIASADRSVSRGGRETVILTNTGLNAVHYIGVKSESREAAEFSLRAFFSLLPFGGDERGAPLIPTVLLPQGVPDGSAGDPQAARIDMLLAAGGSDFKVRRVVFTNTLTHENFGDLENVLLDGTRDGFATLHNHRDYDGPTETFIYEDNGEGDVVGSQPSDGPGSLRNFFNQEASSLWTLLVVDDSLNNTGLVDVVRGYVERAPPTNTVVEDTLVPGGSRNYPFTVPAGATNFQVCITNVSANPQPLTVFVRLLSPCESDVVLSDTNTFDYQFAIRGVSECISISVFDWPPLIPGDYVVTVYNPNTVSQTYDLIARIEMGDIDLRDKATFTSFGKARLLDDAVANASIFVTDSRTVNELEVALRVDHPRVSDLVVHLISPTGKRNLLVENRGGLDPNGFGGGTVFTNAYSAEAGDFEATTNTIPVGANRGTLLMNYTFFQVPDRMRVYYDGGLLWDTGLVSGTNQTFSVEFGPGASTDLVVTMNEGGNSNTNTLWEYTATVVGSTLDYLVLTEDTFKTTTPIKFAPLPLGGLNLAATGTVVFADGFEGAAPGFNQPVGTFLGGWEVVTNSVDVLTNGYNGSTAAEGFQYLDLNGLDAGVVETNLNLTPGLGYVVSFAYSRNPDELTALPQAEVWLGPNRLTTVTYTQVNSWTNLNWQTLLVPFTAPATNDQVLQLRSITPGSTNGILFDAFEIREVARVDRYFLPEEPLDVACENSFGEWQLELWDNRAGAALGPPELVSWELRFVYETFRKLPTRLRHGVPITDTIAPGEMLDLMVDVPLWAGYATNTLLSATAPVNLWVNPVQPPTGISGTDVPVTANVTSYRFTLDTNTSTPLLLVPGDAYFVGIENPGPNPVTITYQVEFDVTPLTNGVPSGPWTLGTNQFGGLERYFSYDVSTNATVVAFDLFDLSGNVNLVARRGELPDTTYDYGSFNPGALDENITVLTNSLPVPLTPGRWYLGVLLDDVQPVNYTLLATEFTNDLSGIITLTNAIPYTNSNSGTLDIEDHYRFVVTNPVARMQFDVLRPTADVALVASKGFPLPTFADYDYLSANGGLSDEWILVLTNSSPMPVSVGEWFLTVINTSGTTADYVIVATQWAVTGQPITISGYLLQSNLFCFSWNSLVGARYLVQAKETLSDTNWVDHSETITATAPVTTYCVTLPSAYHFFRVIEGVVLDSSAGSVAIQSIRSEPGGIILEWLAPPTYEFQVEWTPALAPANWMTFSNIITSTNGNFTFTDDGSQTGGLDPIRYYRLLSLP